MKRTRVAVRKLLGALRVSLAWQPLWWLVWAAFSAAVQILQPGSIDPGEGFALIKILGLIGLASGAAFAVLLASVENGRIIGDVSLGRAAVWGILGTAAVPLLAGKYDQVFPFCTVGMAIAIVLVSIARKGALHVSTNPSGSPGALFAWVFAALQDATTPPSTKPSA